MMEPDKEPFHKEPESTLVYLEVIFKCQAVFLPNSTKISKGHYVGSVLSTPFGVN